LEEIWRGCSVNVGCSVNAPGPQEGEPAGTAAAGKAGGS